MWCSWLSCWCMIKHRRRIDYEIWFQGQPTGLELVCKRTCWTRPFQHFRQCQGNVEHKTSEVQCTVKFGGIRWPANTGLLLRDIFDYLRVVSAKLGKITVNQTYQSTSNCKMVLIFSFKSRVGYGNQTPWSVHSAKFHCKWFRLQVLQHAVCVQHILNTWTLELALQGSNVYGYVKTCLRHPSYSSKQRTKQVLELFVHRLIFGHHLQGVGWYWFELRDVVSLRDFYTFIIAQGVLQT